MNDAEIIVEFKNSKGQWQKKDGHMLPALFKRPNRFQTGRDVRRLMIQSEQGSGLFYVHIERSGAGMPVSMTVLNPARLQPWYDRNNEQIVYWRYTKNNGKWVNIAPEDLLIRRRPDLMDQFGGYAPLSVALKSINSDLGLTDYVDAFFESDGTPSGILKILNASLPDARREALQAQWKKKYSRGGSNQKGIAVLDQNADFQQIGSNLSDLAADQLGNRFESRICAVFGVPPNLVGAYVGLQHVTANATAKSELRNFWENKISPELSTLREWMTWFVLPEFENIEDIQADKVRVNYDVSQVMFLQDDLKDTEERVRKNFQAGGITLNEFRAEIGLPADPQGDYYVQPINVEAIGPENRSQLALGKVPAGGTEPAPAAPEPPKAIEPIIESVKYFDVDGNEVSIDPAGTLEKKTFDLNGLTLGREPQGVELAIDLKKIDGDYQTARQYLAAILAKLRTDLIEQAAAELDKLEPATAHTLSLVPNLRYRSQISKVLKNAYKVGRQQIIAELNAQRTGKGVAPIDIESKDDPEWLTYIDELTDGLIARMISEITKRGIDVYLRMKLLVDYSVEALKAELESQSDKFIDPMAGSTANAAISEGRDDEIKDQIDAGNAGEVMYSAILDANTCGPCADADGETASDPADLPAAPNPDCDGGDKCRCIIVAIAD
jgi:HK97 family phage portal protein